MKLWRWVKLVAGGGVLVVVGSAALMLWPLLWPPDPDASAQVVDGRLIGEATGYVGRIDRDARTVDVSASLIGWRPVVLVVNEATAIMVQDRQGGFEDIWKDMPVRVSYELVGDARLARSIEVVSADSEPVRPVVNGAVTQPASSLPVASPHSAATPRQAVPPAPALTPAPAAPPALVATPAPPAAPAPVPTPAPAPTPAPVAMPAPSAPVVTPPAALTPAPAPMPPAARTVDAAPPRPAPAATPPRPAAAPPPPAKPSPPAATAPPPRVEPTVGEAPRSVEPPAASRPRAESRAPSPASSPNPTETAPGDGAAVIDWLLKDSRDR